MKNSILLDKNIIVDIIQKRSRYHNILNFFNFEEANLAISTSSFLTLFYTLRKEKFQKEEIYNFLGEFETLDITKLDCMIGYDMAKNSDDVEDCAEIALAIRKNCKYFVTADFELFENYNHRMNIKLIT